MVQKDVNGPHTNNISAAQEADGIEIVFYTDPLCCWSWAIDISTFYRDVHGARARNDFRSDMQECKYLNISRLPAIVFKSNQRAAAVISGYQTWENLTDAAGKVPYMHG